MVFKKLNMTSGKMGKNGFVEGIKSSNKNTLL